MNSILRAIDKKDRLGLFAVFELLTDGRLDQSGDFTPGCGLTEQQALWTILFLIHASHDPEEQKIAARLWKHFTV